MTCPRCMDTGRATRVERRLYEPAVTIHDWCDCGAGWALKAEQIEQAEADELDRVARLIAIENTRWAGRRHHQELEQ